MKNQIITIGELAKKTGASEREDFIGVLSAWRIMQRHLPTETENGRMNYGVLQRFICMASNDTFKYGGQGRKAPDFYCGEAWGETKSFKRTDKSAHVAASAFQASNSSVPKHRRLLKEDPAKAKKFLFENSYDKNDLYCLTGNGKVKDTVLDLLDVELIIVDKHTLVECLIPETHYKKVNLELLREKVINEK